MNRWLLILRWGQATALVAGILCVVSPGAADQDEVRVAAAPPKPNVLMSLPPERADRVKMLMGRIKQTNLQLDERLHQSREALEEVYRAYRFDEVRCRRIQQSIRQTQDQLLELHHSFQLQLRGLLTPAEFELLQREFQQGRDEKMDRMRAEEKLKMLRSQQKPAPESKE